MFEKQLLDEELSSEELKNLKERMCGELKPRRLSTEEVEQLKKKDISTYRP